MIKFSINKNAFQNALRITKQAIGSKVTIPALTKLKIEVEENGITLIGSNGQISIKNFLPVDNKDASMLISGTGSVLLEAAFFENVVSQLPEVTLEFTEKEQKQVLLTSGNFYRNSFCCKYSRKSSNFYRCSFRNFINWRIKSSRN